MQLRDSIIYYLTLILFVAFTFLPDNWMWGLSVFRFPDLFAVIVIWIVLAALPILITRFATRREMVTSAGPPLYVWLIGIVAATAWFVLLRTETHFLGDGYTVLAAIAQDPPLLKLRAAGESFLHGFLKSLLPGEPSNTALLSFRLWSFASGVLYLVITAVASIKLFDSAGQRLAFFFGLITAGHVLLFFGYVEYYSIFVLFVAAFVLLGLLILKNMISAWWSVPLVVAASLLHVLGLVLLPATLYLLMHGRAPGLETIQRYRRTVFSIALIIGLVLGVYLWSTSRFIQLAFLPLFATEFRLSDYTLLSLRHITDLVNLALLLLPGLPILLLALFGRGRDDDRRMAATNFLILCTVFCWLPVIFLDPKLGMPRDWDLFAFAGVPLAIFCYYNLLTVIKQRTVAVTVSLLGVVLSLGVLNARALTLHSSDAGIEQYNYYSGLDPEKSLMSRSTLIEYYRNRGDTTAARLEFERWTNIYPEWHWNRRAQQLAQQGRPSDAIELYRQVIDRNPVFSPAYSNLGNVYLQTQQYDSALVYLELARAHNPYNPAVRINLGYAYYFTGRADAAETEWLRAHAMDDQLVQPVQALLKLYRENGNNDRYFQMLLEAVELPDVPPFIYAELIAAYRQRGDSDAATDLLETARRRGIPDSLLVK